MKRVAVLGDGAFGTAIATILADNGHDVLLWCYDKRAAVAIAQQHENTVYAPGQKLSARIIPTVNINEAIQYAPILFQAIPVAYVRGTLGTIDNADAAQLWVTLSKGIEQKTHLLPAQIIASVLPCTRTVAVSGPSFAHDIFMRAPTALVVAGNQTDTTVVSGMLSSTVITCYPSQDAVGVQLAGALKNILALAWGMFEGANLSENTRAWAFCALAQEVKQFACTQGAQPATFDTPAGLGDLVLTCFGSRSRNKALGVELAREGSAYLKKQAVLPESINTLSSMRELAHNAEYQVPLSEQLYRIVLHDAPMSSLIDLL